MHLFYFIYLKKKKKEKTGFNLKCISEIKKKQIMCFFFYLNGT